MKVALWVAIIFVFFCALVSQAQQQNSLSASVKAAAQSTSFQITGGGTLSSMIWAGSYAYGGDFWYGDVYDVWFGREFCAVGQPCPVSFDLPLSTSWPWDTQEACFGTCTIFRTGIVSVSGNAFITPASSAEIDVPITVTGYVDAEYRGDRAQWPLWSVTFQGEGMAHLYLEAGGNTSLVDRVEFTYTGTATAQSFVSSWQASGQQPTGLAASGQYFYESEYDAFGTISNGAGRSFLSPSPNGFDGRSKPSDLAMLGDHLLMSDVGTPSSGAVYEIDPSTPAVVNKFALPFRGGAIAADGARLFIGDLDGTQILVTDHSGNKLRSVSTTLQPAAMVFDPNDNLLWVIERGGGILQATTKGVPIRGCAGPWNPFGPVDWMGFGVQLVDGLGGIAVRDGTLYIAEVNGYEYWRDVLPLGTISIVDSGTLSCSPELPLRVQLDVKPDSFPNAINVKSNGMLPVAVLSTETFEASQIDPASLRFGDSGSEALAANWALADVNGDGRPDLQLQFRVKQAGVACDTTLVSLTGKTYSGKEIRGTDSVSVIGCK